MGQGCWGSSERTLGGCLEETLLRDLRALKSILRFRIQLKIKDRLRVGEAIITARIVDVVFGRLPHKHLHLDQPLHVGVHHDGHL
jgi:hypothetical protein